MGSIASKSHRDPIALDRLNLPPHSTGNVLTVRPKGAMWSGPAVKLQYADSFYWSGAGSAGRAVTIEAVVKKAGTNHSVQLHYNPGGGAWVDLDIPLLLDCGNYIVFRRSENQFSSMSDLVFCLKCIVDGTECWDNNDWQDYRLPLADSRIIPGNIRLERADLVTYECPGWMNAYHSNLSGVLLIRDLDWVKQVGIRYTWDGWQSWSDAGASWTRNYGQGGVQAWQFRAERYTPGDAGTPEFQFAAFYQDGRTGLWFWDNNFGQNFYMKDPGLSHIE